MSVCSLVANCLPCTATLESKAILLREKTSTYSCERSAFAKSEHPLRCADVGYICVRNYNKVKGAGIVHDRPCLNYVQLQYVSKKRTVSLFRVKKIKRKRSISRDQLIRNESRPAEEHMKVRSTERAALSSLTYSDQ
jgi:hypothetical protein